ncbi:MAG: transcriptional repressor LexA [Patescibacteria group bacterium]
MATLTKRQKQILDYVKKYIKKNKISPTFEEIRKRFRLSALSTVHQHIETLSRKGFIEKDGSSARGIKLKKKESSLARIPVLGTITAGQPIEAVEVAGRKVPVPKSEIREGQDYYALQVKGDSMIEEGIFDGDIVVIKKQSVAENGQTVVAIIDDNEATLKKIYREKNTYRLQPANQSMLPLFRNKVEVRGVVVKVVRNFKDSSSKNEQKKIRTIDLFAGVGGIRMGFENAGFETVFANDFDEPCKKTYDLNFKDSKLIVEDIKKIGIDDLPEFDFLLAGFPCQAFSIAGHRQGFKDEKGRGNLFFDIARIIEARKPEGFLLENVKNLRGHDNGRTFKIIMQTLSKLGYYADAKVLNSMEYGNIPQNRERIYIVGFKDKKIFEKFKFPRKKKLTIGIRDLIEKNIPEKYYYNGKPLYEKIKDEITEENKVYQWRRKYVRENKKGVCPTLTANMGMGGHNVPIIKDKKGIRKLTPLECFRIQGYPLDFKLPDLADSALYKQAGNSVTVSVIEEIAKEVKKAMDNN